MEIYTKSFKKGKKLFRINKIELVTKNIEDQLDCYKPIKGGNESETQTERKALVEVIYYVNFSEFIYIYVLSNAYPHITALF